MRLIMIIFLILTSAVVAADVGLEETYVSDDGSFQFDYSGEMQITVVERQSTLSIGNFYLAQDVPIRVEVSIPTPAIGFSNIGLGLTPAEILASRMELWQQTAPIRIAAVLDANLTMAIAPGDVIIHTTDLAGRPAAYASFEYALGDNLAAGVFMVVMDVGYEHLVTITASPTITDGSMYLANYQDDVLALAESLVFNPQSPVRSAEDVILPSAYTGEIGQLQTGNLTFAYPKEWYILSVGSNVFLTNTSQFVTGTPPSGTIQVNIIPPDFNMTAFVENDIIQTCALTPIQQLDITPMNVLQRHLLREDQLALMTTQGTNYTEPQAIEVNQRDIAYMQLFTSERDVLAISVNMGDGNVVSMMTFTAPGEMSTYVNTMLAIAGSFEYQFGGCATS